MASVEHMLNYLLELDPEYLTDWEQEFLEDISELEEDTLLTGPQKDKLKEIYDAH